MSKAYGSRELVRCVKKLGFVFKRQSSSHAIYTPPKGRKSTRLNKNIFVIQLGRKTYEKNARGRYISQLKSFGFTKGEIEKNL